jgi:rare lipoprotein A
MDTSHGNERTANLSGLYRSACTIAALVLMAASAKNAQLPVFAWSQPVTNLNRDLNQRINQEAVTMLAPVAMAPVKVRTIPRIKSGLASWYGAVLQGHRTASGRLFDMNELTAAHRTLPFGSKVRVTDLRNKKSVVVTITDRGDLPQDRVIDLSLGAARQLGMVSIGVDPVRLDLVTNSLD